MKIKELKDKSKPEQEMLLKSSQEKLRELRFKVAVKQHKNVREVRNLKKTIARLLTLLKDNKEKKYVGKRETK
ncbi:MAG: 50S ribosomal protein L29 [Patescibacteria group bacterium]